MLKHKKWLAGFLAVTMLFSLTACGSKEEQPAESEGGDVQLTEWEQKANIFATDETDEELYQQAIEEGGTVTLYSISSRCGKVAEAYRTLTKEVEELGRESKNRSGDDRVR